MISKINYSIDSIEVTVPKAHPICPENPILNMRIVTSEPIDHKSLSCEDLRKGFQTAAWMFVDAMQASLPGGLIDAILGELLTRKASVYVVQDTNYVNPRSSGSNRSCASIAGVK